VYLSVFHTFLLRISVFKGLTARRLYKLFGIKELNWEKFYRNFQHAESSLWKTDGRKNTSAKLESGVTSFKMLNAQNIQH
jgi:hypothetical protein